MSNSTPKETHATRDKECDAQAKLLSKSGIEIVNHFKTKERIQCVYTIKHNPTGRCYVGQTVNVAIRWRTHVTSLQNKKKRSEFQSAWDADGAESFTFSVLELVFDKKTLISLENYWIDLLKAAKGGFNTYVGRKGLQTTSAETIAKIMASRKWYIDLIRMKKTMANKKRTSTITPAQIVVARGKLIQVDAAALLGISRATMQHYERGTIAMRENDFNLLVKLALQAQ